jgi:hypothetical protein
MKSPVDLAAADEAAYLARVDAVLRKLGQAPLEPISLSIKSGSAKPFLSGEWFRNWLKLLKEAVVDSVTALWGRGIRSGIKALPATFSAALRREVIALVEANAPLNATRALKDIAAKTRKGIAKVIRRAAGHYLRNPSPEKLARLTLQVRRRISITPKQVGLLNRWEARARAAGMSEAKIESEILLKVERARTLRARAIASSGTTEAINGGRHAVWKRAIDKGILPAAILKRSRDQQDSRVRSRHRLQSQAAPIPLAANYQLFPVQHPPFERGCRCWDEIVLPEAQIRMLAPPGQPQPVFAVSS